MIWVTHTPRIYLSKLTVCLSSIYLSIYLSVCLSPFIFPLVWAEHLPPFKQHSTFPTPCHVDLEGLAIHFWPRVVCSLWVVQGWVCSSSTVNQNPSMRFDLWTMAGRKHSSFYTVNHRAVCLGQRHDPCRVAWEQGQLLEAKDEVEGRDLKCLSSCPQLCFKLAGSKSSSLHKTALSLLTEASEGWVLISYNWKHLDYWNKYKGDSLNKWLLLQLGNSETIKTEWYRNTIAAMSHEGTKVLFTSLGL
jgi:hypothetical protein